MANAMDTKGTRFGIPHLFATIVVFAISAWLFSHGHLVTACLWPSLCAGIVFGRRTCYPTTMIAFLGLVMGCLYAYAIKGTIFLRYYYNSNAFDYLESECKTIASDARVVMICLVATLWVVAILMTCWLLASTFRRFTALAGTRANTSSG